MVRCFVTSFAELYIFTHTSRFDTNNKKARKKESERKTSSSVNYNITTSKISYCVVPIQSGIFTKVSYHILNSIITIATAAMM